MSAGRGAETSILGSPQPPEELEALEADEEHAAEELKAAELKDEAEEDPEEPVEVNRPPTARFNKRKCGC